MIDIFEEMILILLLGATIVSAINVFMHVLKVKKIKNDFSLLISIFIIGWFLSEVLLLSGNEFVDSISGYIHVIIIAAFAIMLTIRYRWAVREAKRLEE